MKSYTVSLQGFKTLENEFVLKEVCLARVETNWCHHYMVRSPITYQNLNDDLKKRVDYVTEFIHGIPWDSNGINEEKALFKMKMLLQNSHRVYAKGSEQVAYLKKILSSSVRVVDLDGYYPPPPKIGYSFPDLLVCSDHKKHRFLRRCALVKAISYRQYLRKNYK